MESRRFYGCGNQKTALDPSLFGRVEMFPLLLVRLNRSYFLQSGSERFCFFRLLSFIGLNQVELDDQPHITQWDPSK